MAPTESVFPHTGWADIPRPRKPGESNGSVQDSHATPLHLRVDWLPRERTAVIKASGVLDALTVHRFAALVDSRLRGMVRKLVLDLSDVQFLATAGLEVLANAALRAKYRDIELSVAVGESRPVRRAITVSGLDRRLPVRQRPD